VTRGVTRPRAIGFSSLRNVGPIRPAARRACDFQSCHYRTIMLQIGLHIEGPKSHAVTGTTPAHAAPDIAGSASSPPPGSGGAAARTAAPSRHSRPPRFWQNETPQFILARSMSCAQVSAQATGVAAAVPRLVDRRRRIGPVPLRPWTSGTPADNSLSGEDFPVLAMRIPCSTKCRESAASHSRCAEIRRPPSPNRRKQPQIRKIRCYFPCWQGMRRPGRNLFLTRSASVDCRRQASMQ